MFLRKDTIYHEDFPVSEILLYEVTALVLTAIKR